MATSRREREKQERRKVDAREWAKKQEKGYDATCVKLPEGIEFYKLEPGTHLVDFMPYIVGDHNPRADKGMIHFERQYEAHRVPTPNGNFLYTCRGCFDKSCYICQWLQQHGKAADEALVKLLRRTTRHLWLVNDKPGDKKNPLKIFDSNHYNRGMGFGEMMADAITAVPDYADFADLEKGMTLQLTVKEQTFPGGKYNAVMRIDFRPRKYSYPEELLDTAPCLDDCLVLVGNEDLKKALGQEQVEDEEPETPSRASNPSGNGRSHNEDEDQDGDVVTNEDLGVEAGDTVEYDGETCTIKRISGDGTSLTLEDSDGKVHKGVACSEVSKPKATKGSKATAPVDEDDLDEDEDEDDED